MKPLLSAPDDEEFWEGLASRVAMHPGIRCVGEYSAGLKYIVRVPSASLIAIIEPEFHDSPRMGVPQVWRHLSVSAYRPARVPSWDELKRCKDVFLGEDARAVMVFPSKAEYVNHHEFVLHLFSGPDELPDFRSAYMVGGQFSI